jgi:hypothetical protein
MFSRHFQRHLDPRRLGSQVSPGVRPGTTERGEGSEEVTCGGDIVMLHVRD